MCTPCARGMLHHRQAQQSCTPCAYTVVAGCVTCYRRPTQASTAPAVMSPHQASVCRAHATTRAPAAVGRPQCGVKQSASWPLLQRLMHLCMPCTPVDHTHTAVAAGPAGWVGTSFEVLRVRRLQGCVVQGGPSLHKATQLQPMWTTLCSSTQPQHPYKLGCSRRRGPRWQPAAAVPATPTQHLACRHVHAAVLVTLLPPVALHTMLQNHWLWSTTCSQLGPPSCCAAWRGPVDTSVRWYQARGQTTSLQRNNVFKAYRRRSTS